MRRADREAPELTKEDVERDEELRENVPFAGAHACRRCVGKGQPEGELRKAS